MTTDELSAPLGKGVPRKRRIRLPFTAAQAIAMLLAVFLLGFAGFAIFNDDPLGGEPLARVVIRDIVGTPQTKPAFASKPEAAPAAAHGAPQTAAAPESKAAPSAGDRKTITIIDGSSGARRDVVVPTTAPEQPRPADSASGPMTGGVNQKLLEASRYGMIPVAADGLKPSRAYAAGSDALRARAATLPAIAIVVGGLGVGAAKTDDAIMKLPGAVTLAFTPYGADPAKLAERARAQGHEILLQLPMEPFDYPDNDPGPQTMLTSLSAEQNLDRLAWHLSRFQGYVGVSNLMGARLLATEAAMQPLMQDLAKRGLVYLDDGAASRSTAGQMAETLAIPFARADSAIDAIPTAAEIDRTLGQLESAARQRGIAVGVASALPVTIARIAAWAKSLESRGVLLVPLTTALQKSKSS